MKRFLNNTVVARFVVGVIIFVIASGFVFPVAASAIGATTDGGTTNSTQTKFQSISDLRQASQIWSQVQAAIYQCTFDKGASVAERENGQWFRGDANIGIHVEPGDGRAKCEGDNGAPAWVSQLLGFSLSDTERVDAFNGILRDINSSNIGSGIEAQRSALTKFFNERVFDKQGIPTIAPDYVAYSVLYNAFVSAQGCGAGPTASVGGRNSADIYVYDQGKVGAAVKYAYSRDKDDTVLVGRGMPGDNKNDGEMQCQAIAAQLAKSQYAKSVVAWAEVYKNTNGVDPTISGLTADSSDAPRSCESMTLSTLNIVICPLISLFDNAISFLDEQIQRQLTVTQEVFNNSVRQTWGVVRNIAFLLLVPIMLVMVIGTALEIGPFDPYTVRKALPRMLFAVVFIALSWPVCLFLVNVSNVVGTGILGLLTTAFSQGGPNGGITLGSISGGSNADLATQGGLFLGLLLGGPIAYLAGSGSIGIIASYAFVTALALFIAFLILTIRQVVIVALVLMAPVAILAWIFPGNDKIWKIWWESFSKLLIMFPLIMILIAAGRIFASVIDSTNSGGDVTSTLLKITAYLVPYFFIPATFKLAGGIFATIAGVTNDRSRGIFDRQKKYRAEAREKGMERAREGNRFSGKGRLRRGLNEKIAYGMNFNPTTAGVDPRYMRARMRAHMSSGEYAEIKDALDGKNQLFSDIAGNDDLLEAGRQSFNRSQISKYLEGKGYTGSNNKQATEAVIAAQRSMGAGAFRGAAAVAIAGTGTGYKDGGALEMFDAINDAAGSDRSLAARLLNDARSAAGQARRVDLNGAGFGKSLTALNSLVESSDATYENYQKKKITGYAAKREAISKDMDILALESQGGYQIVNARQSTVARLAPYMVERVEVVAGDLRSAYAALQADPDNEATEKAFNAAKRLYDQELAVIAGRYDSMQGISPENAKALANGVLSQKIKNPITGEETTVFKEIDTRRTSEDFVSMRREYADRAALNDAARQQQQASLNGMPPGAPPTMPK